MTASSISDGLPSLSPAPSDATEESPAPPPELASAKGGGEPAALTRVFDERVDQDVRYVSIISSSEMPKLIKGVGMSSLTGLSFGHFSGNLRLVDLPEF